MKPIQRAAFIGNHLPRRCGIATFTHDLHRAVAMARPGLETCVAAMNDPGGAYDYPAPVRFQIQEETIDAYAEAADFLNTARFDVVSLQHEYGIFGGKAGSHVLSLLRELRMPIVTPLHTILAEPNPLQRAAMDEITRLSERLVVMSQHGATLLRDVHGVAADRIDLIPHGIPNVASARRSKDQLGVEGRSRWETDRQALDRTRTDIAS